jgi:hypothetical protein
MNVGDGGGQGSLRYYSYKDLITRFTNELSGHTHLIGAQLGLSSTRSHNNGGERKENRQRTSFSTASACA